MQRLSACAQGAKRSDSKASMSAFGWLHQEGGAWQCGAVSRSASGSKHVQGRSASESGPCLLLAAARVSSITRHRAAVLRVMQGEARAARAGEAFCACRVLLRVRALLIVGKFRSNRRLIFRSALALLSFTDGRTKFDFASDSCCYKKSRVPVLRD